MTVAQMFELGNIGRSAHIDGRGADTFHMAPPTLSRVRSRFLGLILLVAMLLGAPAAALAQPDSSGLAPAIGPWAGAPKGQITFVSGGDDSLSITGVARDPDSVTAVSYDILVDGEVAVRGVTPRPAGYGRTAEFSETIDVSAGVHDVCLRLNDDRLGARTVHCRQAVTAPPTTVAQSTIDSATGVAITTSGVVVPILGGEPGNLRVLTPCGNEATISEARIVERAQVVIDPGHGGVESGAVGGGLLEKNVNLQVSQVVISKLERLGISAELTRTGDYRVPIQTRADIATALAPDVFLSLHHNGGAVRPSSRPGTEVFYSEARPNSERLARIMYEELNAAAAQFSASWVSTVNEGASLRLREDGRDLYGVHRYSPELDSVITEFLYLSNSSEAALMRRDDVIEAEAQAIVDGILRWWFTDDGGTTRGRVFTDSSSSGTGGFDGCSDPALNSGAAGYAEIQRGEVLALAAENLENPPTTVGLHPMLGLANDPAIEHD